MEFPKVPGGAIPYIAVAVGGVIAWRILSGGSSDAAPQIVQTGYDPELVALGTQSALKTKEIEAQQAIATKAMDTEIQTTMLSNELARYGIDSDERKFGGELGLRNSELSVRQNLGLTQIEAQRQTNIITAQNQVELARIESDAKVKAAKASKSKGFSCCGLGLKF